MPESILYDSEEKARFLREARAAAALDHPNIVAIHEIAEEESQSFIAMTYVDGSTLKQKLKSGPLEIGKAIDLAKQIAEGLREAHNKNIIHRDIKSTNIMVTQKGQVTIPIEIRKLLGLKTSDETTFKVPFPEDYAAKELAGKEAEFAVTVKKVEEPKLPEIDEDFAKSFGVETGDTEQLKNEIRANMNRELSKRLRVLLKERVMDALLVANPIDVPSAVVAEEAATLKKQTEIQTPGSNLAVDTFMNDAKRRVQLGMVLAEVAKISSLNIDADMVKARIEEMAKDYDDADEFVRYYMGNQELLSGVQTLVMEDAVVDWIAGQAKITATNSSFDVLMNPDSK